MKLNLGCGAKKLPGWVNVDVDGSVNPDFRVDLNYFPWPLKTHSAGEVLIEHCLEHLDDPLKALQELHRVAKPGARIMVRVPHYTLGGYDFTHKSFWSVDAFSSYKTEKLFFLKSRRLKWLRYGSGQRKLYYPLFFLAPVVDWLANLQPVVCERFWCYWVGGFEEIEFELVNR